MITKIFTYLTDYAAFRRLIWKPLYEGLSRKFKVRDWSFMNYGYAPSENEAMLSLEHTDEINRYPIQLYYYLAAKVQVAGLDVLEVGSGRGGGSSFIKRYLHPQKITGLDIAAHAVKMANENYGHEGIEFKQGSAEKIPFADNSFDVIINVESCHAYGSVPVFLSEVKRVLRPGGFFLCADIRTAQGMMVLIRQLNASSMEGITEENISENVARAIELEEPVKQKRIRENIPGWMQKPFNEFAGVMGSRVHKELISGKLVYMRFLLQKPHTVGPQSTAIIN